VALYVNGEKIGTDEIEEEIERLRPHHDRVFADMPPDERDRQLAQWSRENVIERVLLQQAARRDGEAVDPGEIESRYQELLKEHDDEEAFLKTVGETREKIKRDLAERIRIDRLVDRITGPVPEPSEEAIRKHYEEHRDQYTTPSMVRASHIVKHFSRGTPPSMLKKKMEKVLAKVRAEGNFEELVAKHSDCPENAGDLGYFPRGQMVPAFEEVVFNLKKGEISHVFKTEFGFHVAVVTDKRPPALVPLDQVREQIVEEFKDRVRQKAVEDFLDGERAAATVESEEEEDPASGTRANR
jgi:parvulin-like peptidyl-prolyl isomerase